MTVAPVNPSIGYIGNGATTVFSYPFEITAKSALRVTRVVRSTLQKTVLVLDVDYTVNLTNSEVTMLAPPSSSIYIELRRIEPYEQDTSYSTQGNFSPTTLEDALDYITMLTQQLNEKLVGSTDVVRLPSVAVGALPSALTAAPALIYVYNASGGGIPCFSDGTNWRRVDTRGIVS